jgi:hypothetical protein
MRVLKVLLAARFAVDPPLVPAGEDWPADIFSDSRAMDGLDRERE